MAEFNATYHIFKDYGVIFDETKNQYGSLRLVQWVNQSSEPDESKAKLELRKIIAKDEGEVVGKGFSFSTKEGPHELAEGLVSVGFGNTKKIIRSLVKRDDFKDSLDTINQDEDENDDSADVSESSIFDMRNLMNIMDDGSSDEE